MSIIKKILQKYSNINAFLVSRRSRLSWFAAFSFLLSASILSLYAWYYITHPVSGYNYDIDGWGHLIPEMIASGKSWELLLNPVHRLRNFLVPFFFGLSYCLIGIPESGQILNIFVQSLNSMMLVSFFSSSYKNPILGFFIGLVWAMWYPFSSYYGYYFSEPIYGFVFVLIWIFITRFLQTPKWSAAIPVGILLAIAIHVKITSLLVVLGCFFCCVTIWRSRAAKFAPIMLASFLVFYLPWPIYNSIKHHQFVTISQKTQSGTGLWGTLFLMTYLPADSLETNIRETIPAYRHIKEQAETMDVEARKDYYRKIIIEQIKKDPFGQLGLLLRRFMRFWYYVPAYSFLPTTRTLVIMTPLLLLAFIGIFHWYQELHVQSAILLISGMWILHGIIHSEFRYQFPVFPMLLFLAFAGTSIIVHHVTDRNSPASNEQN